MKCDEVETILIDYLEGNLDEKAGHEIEKHLEGCNSCLDSLRESQDIMKLMSASRLEKPDELLRISFYHMLHDEIKKEEKGKKMSMIMPSAFRSHRSIFYAAAGIALLICGTLLGMLISTELSGRKNSEHISRLQSEVTALKETAIYSMLSRQSSSDRIQAVNYVDDLPNPDQPIIDVLVNTLNHDKNVNVRMAAAYALEKFADKPSVCNSLVRSLSQQEDPILQVTLINILVERKVKSAVAPIRQIINNKSTLKEVRTVAESGIKTLI